MNRKLRCLIVEDESAGRKLIEAFVKKIPYLVCAGTFGSAAKAADFLEERNTDILITDIEMPGMTGLELARLPLAPPAVIFTTAYRDFAPEGFDISAVDYIVKPVRFDRFEKAIAKAKDLLYLHTEDQQPAPHPGFLFVKKDNGYLKLSLDEIVVIEAEGDYVHVFTSIGDRHTMRKTLAELRQRLPESQFIQVHRSYLVNIHAIQLVFPTAVQLTNGKEIPLSRNYRQELARRMGIG